MVRGEGGTDDMATKPTDTSAMAIRYQVFRDSV